MPEIADIQTKEVYIFKLPVTKSLNERADGMKSIISNATIVTIEENEDVAFNDIIEKAAEADVILGTHEVLTASQSKTNKNEELNILTKRQKRCNVYSLQRFF